MSYCSDVVVNQPSNDMYYEGQHVLYECRYEGTIVRQYIPGMWEVRLTRGVVCVSEKYLTPVM